MWDGAIALDMTDCPTKELSPHMTTQKRLPPNDTSTFESIHRDFTVARIATPREELETCNREEPIAAIQERNTERYDYLPVKDDGSIICSATIRMRTQRQSG